jgi:hypothetical protein
MIFKIGVLAHFWTWAHGQSRTTSLVMSCFLLASQLIVILLNYDGTNTYHYSLIPRILDIFIDMTVTKPSLTLSQ